MSQKTDEDGCPVLTEKEQEQGYADACPDNPCRYCKGDSMLSHETEKRYLTSWEWCQEMNTCAVTCDWDVIYGYG